MRRTTFILFLIAAATPCWANFFAERCAGAWTAIAELRVMPNARAEAARRNLTGFEREEFLRRQLRLGFVEAKHVEADGFYSTSRDLLQLFEQRLTGKPEMNKTVLWKRLVEEYFTTTDVQAIKASLPPLLSYDSYPTPTGLLVGMAAKEVALARYRLEVSRALCELPLNKKISDQNEHAQAKAIAAAEQIATAAGTPGSRGNYPEIARITTSSDPSWQAKLDLTVLKEARRLAADEKVPEHIRKQIQDQLDFMADYSLSPIPNFREYIFAAAALQESP